MIGPVCGLVVGVAPIRNAEGRYTLVWVYAPSTTVVFRDDWRGWYGNLLDREIVLMERLFRSLHASRDVGDGGLTELGVIGGLPRCRTFRV